MKRTDFRTPAPSGAARPLVRGTLAAAAALLFAAPVRLSGGELAADGSAGAGQPPIDALVALVNNEAVTISDVMRDIASATAAVRRRPDAPKDDEALFRLAFREALDGIVDRRLVVQKYWEGEQRLPKHAIDRTTAEILEDRYGGNIQNLLSDLATERMTYGEWREKMEERLIVASMRHTFADGSAHVSAAEIAAAYEARKAEFSRTARTKVRLASFSGVEARAAAAAAAEKLSHYPPSGLAAAFGSLVDADQVQDLGFVIPEEDLAPALAEVAGTLADGEVSAPVEIGGSWFLLLREASEKGDAKPLSEVWDDLRSELLAQKRAEAFKAWIRHLREDAVIVDKSPF